MTILHQALDLFTPEELDLIHRFEDLTPEEKRQSLTAMASYVMIQNNLAYGHTLVEGGNLDEAVSLIENALAMAPRWMAPELLDTKASILTRQGLHEEASSALSRATLLAPRRNDFKLRLARILLLEGKEAEATTLAEETLTRLLDAPQPELEAD